MSGPSDSPEGQDADAGSATGTGPAVSGRRVVGRESSDSASPGPGTRGHVTSGPVASGSETEAGGELSEPAPVGRRASWLLGGSFVALILAAALVWLPLPYVIFSPGPVTDTLGKIDGQPIIDVTGASTYPTSGELFFTTVRMNGGPGRRVNVYDLVAAKLDDTTEVVDESLVFPEDATQESVEAESTAEMANSQQVAAAVAQRALGKKVPVEISVDSVVKDGPSEGIVEKGDIILRVDGADAASPAAVRQAVLDHSPGEPVELVVRRSGAEKTLTVTTRKMGDRAIIGIVMAMRYELPIPVDIHAGAVGGPSAGMIFTLAIYDVLTPGSLTGGKAVAGSGTIADDGSVGPIGGIRQKLVGAERGGARWFLVAAANCGEVVGHVPDGMTVVKVATFTEALRAVESIAKGATDTLPACTS